MLLRVYTILFRCLGPLLIIMCYSLIFGCSYVILFLVLPSRYPSFTFPYLFHLTLFLMELTHSLTYYTLCIITSPGTSAHHFPLKTDTPQEWSFCTYCEKEKPPQAHHCRVCSK